MKLGSHAPIIILIKTQAVIIRWRRYDIIFLMVLAYASSRFTGKICFSFLYLSYLTTVAETVSHTRKVVLLLSLYNTQLSFHLKQIAIRWRCMWHITIYGALSEMYIFNFLYIFKLAYIIDAWSTAYNFLSL